MSYKITVISDTHGLLRPSVIPYVESADLVVHAGDIGTSDVLVDLKSLKPTFAVLGNVDQPTAYPGLTYTKRFEVNQVSFLLIHNLDLLSIDPASEGINIVIYGHSHQPAKEYRNNVIYFNPGSVGPRRFSLPISLGTITLEPEDIKLDHHTLS